MVEYILTALILVVFGNIVKSKKEKSFIFIVCLWMALIIGLRDYTIGTDTYTYSIIYRVMGNTSLSSYIADNGYGELLFFILNNIMYSLSLPFQFLLIIEAILIMWPVYKFTTEHSKIPWFSLMLFLGLGSMQQAMNVSRQYIAIGLILIAAIYAFNEQKKKFLLFVILAFMFHSSALIAIFIYPIVNNRQRNLNWIYIALVPMGFIILNLFSGITMKYMPENYINDSNGGGYKILILWIIILIVLLFYSKYCKDQIVNIEIRLLSISIFFQSFVSDFVVIGRISYFFSILFYLLLPNIFINISEYKSRIIIIQISTSLVLIYYIFISLYRGASNTVPYKWGAFL